MSAAMESEEAAAEAALEPDSTGWPSYLCWPSVKQHSSLFEFLEKCGEGAVINCIAEDTTVQKTSDNRWHPTQRSATIGETCSSEALVRAIRSARPQPERGDYSKLIVIATPWEPMSVKKEIVESAEHDDEEVESEDDDGAGASEMSLQFVDLTDDAPIPAPPVVADALARHVDLAAQHRSCGNASGNANGHGLAHRPRIGLRGIYFRRRRSGTALVSPADATQHPQGARAKAPPWLPCRAAEEGCQLLEEQTLARHRLQQRPLSYRLEHEGLAHEREAHAAQVATASFPRRASTSRATLRRRRACGARRSTASRHRPS